MKFKIEIVNYNKKCIDETIFIHNLDNGSVIQLDGTAKFLFTRLTQLLSDGSLNILDFVNDVINQYPEMKGNENLIERDIIEFLNELKNYGLIKIHSQ